MKKNEKSKPEPEPEPCQMAQFRNTVFKSYTVTPPPPIQIDFTSSVIGQNLLPNTPIFHTFANIIPSNFLRLPPLHFYMSSLLWPLTEKTIFFLVTRFTTFWPGIWLRQQNCTFRLLLGAGQSSVL